MADRLSPDEASLGQCVWSVVAAAMDEDLPAIEYLLSGLTETDLGAVIVALAGILGGGMAAAHGREQARAMVAAKAVHYAAGASE